MEKNIVLSFDIKKSNIMALFLTSMHTAALLSIIFVTIAFSIKYLLSLLCIASFYSSLLRYALLKSRKSIVKAELKSNNVWYFETKKYGTISGILQKNSVITPFCSLLNFRLEKEKRNVSLVIFADAIERNEFRRLRSLILTKKNIIEKKEKELSFPKSRNKPQLLSIIKITGKNKNHRKAE